MDRQKEKAAGLRRRQRRVRGKVSGTAAVPRLRVTRSNGNIYAQVIDDVARRTLAAASSLDAEFKKQDGNGATVDGARVVGGLIGRRALDAKIESVVFDRGGYLFHGRVKALADAAREAGLRF
ncbi:MAG: 50S ribosomal protein L18 [Coriobacteriales bacterium]|jgi:large subunit ribosomal protein L18|nr:50S ribosomal protein L18 [Coriobacteriales bacterium]